MRAYAHARAHVCMSASEHLRILAASRQPVATFLPGPCLVADQDGTPPGWRLTAKLKKVSAKCKKVEKSFGGSAKSIIFAGDI